MPLQGVPTKPIPYLLESQRELPPDQKPTIIHIQAKTGHDQADVMAAYAASSKDVRGGYKEINTRKFNSAVIREWLRVVIKVENYQFTDRFPELATLGIISFDDEGKLEAMCMDIDPTSRDEVFDASNDVSLLMRGKKKDLL